MTAKNKIRGNDFEREIVKKAQANGFDAKRAWGSNGASCGWAADVDLEVAGIKLQAKRRKALPSYLQIPTSCEGVVFKQDRNDPMVLISLKMFWEICDSRAYNTYWSEIEDKVFGGETVELRYCGKGKYIIHNSSDEGSNGNNN